MIRTKIEHALTLIDDDQLLFELRSVRIRWAQGAHDLARAKLKALWSERISDRPRRECGSSLYPIEH